MKKVILATVIILLVVFFYAIVRYNIIKGTPWIDLPLYTSNKAISLSSVIFIAVSYALGSLARFWPQTFFPTLVFRKFFGLFGFGLAAIHGFISLLIFSPEYYPKFFLETGKLNLTGELSMLFGVLAFFVFAIVALASVPGISNMMTKESWLRIQRIGYLGLLLVFFHVFVMGFQGWLKPAGWPGGLLPISMLAAIAIALVLLLKLAAIIIPEQKNIG